nr:YdaS family helix-turn-helix protein [Escherichia coli]
MSGLNRASAGCFYKWLHNKAKVSPEHVGSIVTATGGVVKAYQIRPDLPKLFPHTEKNAA